MKNKIIVSLYIFIFITLFLCLNCTSFASAEDDVLNGIAEAGVTRNRVTSGGQYLEDNYVVEIPGGTLSSYYSDGKIVIDGKSYRVDARIEVDGEYVSIAKNGTTLSMNEDGNYELPLRFQNADKDGKVYEGVAGKGQGDSLGYKTQYVLVPEDGSEEIVLETDDMTLSKSNSTKSSGATTVGDVIWDGVIKNDNTVIVKLLTETLSKIALPVGDAFLHMLSLAVGEKVSIDGIVYDEVGKVNIDFFEKSGTGNSLKKIMSDVVTDWYRVFQGIAVTALLAMLVFMGIRILLASTGEKKATYKGIFVAWVTGVAILFLFPYVMKYTIKLNHALCTWIGKEAAQFYGGGGLAPTEASKEGIYTIASKYGKDEFVAYMTGLDTSSSTLITGNGFGNNAMMRIRYIAGKTWNLPLTVVYFILIGELLALLIIYYKRVFMLAFLITIFPLVAAFYPINKIGAARMNCFGIWFKEFLVNVLVQSFHAVTYTTVTMIGINAYLQTDNWLFMILSILFLFEGEKIIRAIFNARSSMNTIGDLAMSGMMAYGIAKSMSGLAKGKGKSNADNTSSADPASVAERDRNNATGLGGSTGASTVPGIVGTGTGGGPGAGGDSGEVKLGRNVPTIGNMADNISGIVGDRANGSRLGKAMNLASRGLGTAASGLAQATGGVLGYTFGMAQKDNKTGADAAVAGGITGLNAGKQLGQGVKSAIGGVAGKVSIAAAGYAVAKDIENGQYDGALGLNEADKVADQEKQKAYREIYAKVARKRGRGNKTGAEILFIKEQLSQMKK